jgi:hypothetical protein
MARDDLDARKARRTAAPLKGSAGVPNCTEREDLRVRARDGQKRKSDHYANPLARDLLALDPASVPRRS